MPLLTGLKDAGVLGKGSAAGFSPVTGFQSLFPDTILAPPIRRPSNSRQLMRTGLMALLTGPFSATQGNVSGTAGAMSKEKKQRQRQPSAAALKKSCGTRYQQATAHFA